MYLLPFSWFHEVVALGRKPTGTQRRLLRISGTELPVWLATVGIDHGHSAELVFVQSPCSKVFTLLLFVSNSS